jgi:hypothetical protein
LSIDKKNIIYQNINLFTAKTDDNSCTNHQEALYTALYEWYQLLERKLNKKLNTALNRENFFYCLCVYLLSLLRMESRGSADKHWQHSDHRRAPYGSYWHSEPGCYYTYSWAVLYTTSRLYLYSQLGCTCSHCVFYLSSRLGCTCHACFETLSCGFFLKGLCHQFRMDKKWYSLIGLC